VNTTPDKKIARAPIVAIMGHIDHGKSTLLDYIRKSNVVDKEFGGITQHIKAYKTPQATFLDTPGHEAFLSVRRRGSSIADIVILIISAEDGVKPQTIESIKCIKENKVPFIVAVNKIDKPNADVNKVKQELAEHEIFVEGWGGNTPIALISAKTGQGIPELLDTLALLSEIEEIQGDPELPAEGFVIESEKDPKKGVLSVLVIKNGTLNKGGFVVAGSAYCPVRLIEDFSGKVVNSASLSDPVRITGWNEQPPVGSRFIFVSNKKEAEELAKNNKDSEPAAQGATASQGKAIPVILRADTIGSLEAIKSELQKLANEKITTKIISEGIGPISLNDIKFALSSTEPLILSFNVKADGAASELAMRSGLPINSFNIIYELLDFAKEKLTELTPKQEMMETAGTAKILKTFSQDKKTQVLGGRVEQGTIEKDTPFKILRRDAEIGDGRVRELQIMKQKTSAVNEGNEFGMMVESKIEIAPGDKLVTYRIVTK
jgi:translation initiation factor IF-2